MKINKVKLREKIHNILLSKKYKKSIKHIAKNYFNLKQEFWFRNLLLEQLNEDFEKNGHASFKAIAEHPRVGGKRVDLSIVDSENLNSPYLVEFKFQYSGDLGKHNRTRELIEKDFDLRGSDMFILIILDFDVSKGISIDETWGIENGISKYISKTKNWKENLITSTSEYREENDLLETDHKVQSEGIDYKYKIIAISK